VANKQARLILSKILEKEKVCRAERGKTEGQKEKGVWGKNFYKSPIL
jgi:hypothetical protein